MLKLTKERTKGFHVLTVNMNQSGFSFFGKDFIDFVCFFYGSMTDIAFKFWSDCKHISSFLLKYFEAKEQSKPLYLLSHGFYFGMSTHAKRIKSWLFEAKKTCQVRFLEVEARREKACGYFAQRFVIFNGVDLTISN